MSDKRFLLNTNSKKFHDLKYSDGRCKISDMSDSYKICFDTYTEASEYPDKENPLAKFCTICQKNKEKNKISSYFETVKEKSK